MSSNKRQQVFLESDLAVEIHNQLIEMENDPAFITNSSYMASTKTDISFSDKHFSYISNHRDIQPQEYVNNLRLRTKLR